MLRRIGYFLSSLGLCASLVACVSSPAYTTLGAQCASLQWEPVAPGLWVLHGHEVDSNPANQGRVSNIVFARENTDTLPRGWLIGSGPSQRVGQLLRCSLEQQLGATVTDVVSPRAHPESVLGASAFAGARHWALPQVALAMQQRCPQCSQRLAATIEETSIAQQTIAIPTQYLTARPLTDPASPLVRHEGPFDLWAVMLDAQEWTTIFRHRSSGLWFAPGLVWGAQLVPDVHDADVYRLTEALQALQAFQPAMLIPEQGQAAGPELVRHNAQYWKSLEAHTAQAIRQGATDVNALEAPGPTAWQSAPGVSAAAQNRDRHSLNQQRVWRQLEQIYFDTPKP